MFMLFKSLLMAIKRAKRGLDKSFYFFDKFSTMNNLDLYNYII